MMTTNRLMVGLLSLSAAAFVGYIAAPEGYADRAVIPVKGDRPTVGFGSTFRDDGSPVRLGDTITPVPALKRALAHVQKDERGIKRCVTAPLTQVEYDLMVGFSYQYGVPTLCASTIVREANALRYKESCAGYLKFKFAGGFDCSTPKNKRCPGVWTRSQNRYTRCIGEQS
ncbi:MAG: lysozyme [Proteobacteria bacterium]|nr:lysozyme [Pseudomonadota bacterium]